MSLPTAEPPLLSPKPPLTTTTTTATPSLTSTTTTATPPLISTTTTATPPPHLRHSLNRLTTYLTSLGFIQHTPLTLSLSSLSFLLLAALAPAFVVFFYCSSSASGSCRAYNVERFEVENLVCQAAAAAVSLFCVSRNLSKYGLRKFLFVDDIDDDKSQGSTSRFHDQYVRKIDDFFRMLFVWVLPCLILKTAREIVRVIYVGDFSLVQSVIRVSILLVSWAYSATVYLSGSKLFSLVCNLQAVHLENYRELLESDLDVLVYIEEHARLTYHLSKISHRFRIFLILEFLIVTASQFVVLLETTGNHDRINFINAADFAISSIVQVVGILICLNAAAKVSHRTQGLASFASRWHTLATCNLNETSIRATGSVGNLDTARSVVPVINYSDIDLESADYVLPTTSMQVPCYVSSYHKREAFGFSEEYVRTLGNRSGKLGEPVKCAIFGSI